MFFVPIIKGRLSSGGPIATTARADVEKGYLVLFAFCCALSVLSIKSLRFWDGSNYGSKSATYLLCSVDHTQALTLVIKVVVDDP